MGGQHYDAMKNETENTLDEINKEVASDGLFSNVEDLDAKLENYKKQFMEFDENSSADICIMELKRMMDKLGQAKTYIELSKMISEVDSSNSGTITYHEFLVMMLGDKSSVLKEIMLFEETKKGKERTDPPVRESSDFP